MEDRYLPAPGILIPASALELRRAREVAQYVGERDDLYSKLIECRKGSGYEAVVFDVEVQRPQLLAAPIEAIERIAAVFSEADRSYPDVLALRRDFPLVLHLNQREEEFPRALCLYALSWPDVRVRWTAPSFVERIRWWLARTARGEIHAADQPLEALLLSWGYWLVLPPSQTGEPRALWSVHIVGGKEGKVFVAHDGEVRPGRAASGSDVVLHFVSPPRRHATSPILPRTLSDVCRIISVPGFDLLAQLRERLKTWPKEREGDLKARVILLIDLPKTRTEGGAVETVDRKAFLLVKSGLDLGASIGVWQLQGDRRGLLVPPDTEKRGEEAPVLVVNVVETLTKEMAASLNGVASPSAIKVVAVGLGALGSQVVMNLSRGGFGEWTLIDNDFVLPHNLARHFLDGFAIGMPKVLGMAHEVKSLFSDGVVTPIVTDILDPGEHSESVRVALEPAELTIDMSASVAVARHVAHMPAGGRRASLFLSPSGFDLVLLLESADRTHRLDELEMHYYTAVTENDRLAGHLDDADGRTRYGLSCRDISVRLPQTAVAALSGIGAEAIRNGVGSGEARAQVWRLNPETFAVERVNLPVPKFTPVRGGEWAVLVSAAVLEQTGALRSSHLPNETGGILIGGVDYERRVMYVVAALPSPPDSEEWPELYIRGCEGLKASVEKIIQKTAGSLVYLGEWHSHPRHTPTLPSRDDLTVLAAVSEWVRSESRPGIMLIAGDENRSRLFVGTYDPSHPPEELWLA